jgi:hypothetical protein
MGYVVSITPLPRFTPGTHCTGGWVGPRDGLDAGAREKNPLSLGNRIPVFQSVVIHYIG